jgi:hypothetical protein
MKIRSLLFSVAALCMILSPVMGLYDILTGYGSNRRLGAQRIY